MAISPVDEKNTFTRDRINREAALHNIRRHCPTGINDFAGLISSSPSLLELQPLHTKKSTGNPRFGAHLFHWTGVEKAVLEEAKSQINQNPEDLLYLGAYLIVESRMIGKIP